MNHTIERNLIGRYWGKVKTIAISDNNIEINYKNSNVEEIPLSQVVNFPYIKSSIFGNTLIFETSNKRHNISFISAKSKMFFEKKLKDIIYSQICLNIEKNIELFYSEAVNQYLRDSSVERLNTLVTPLINNYKKSKKRWEAELSREQTLRIESISEQLPISNIDEFRAEYEKKMLNIQKDFFDGIESNPLTVEQRLGVIRNNDRNLVLAAAGTGKTSVMVAKALSLIVHDKIPAERILVLAYNNAAAKELKDRLEERKESFGLLCASPTIMTFHALGLKILKDSKISTRLSIFSEDPIQLEIWFSKWLVKYICQSPRAMRNFIDLSYQPSNPYEFSSQEEYENHVRDNEYRTLKGELVKGYQELLIANWFFLNSIEYEYEPKYVSKRRIEIGFDYKPDFKISNSDIYLEHFGISRDGSTRADIDAKQYNEHMISKRALHEECETTLIETYHYDWVEDNLLQRLEELMVELKIEITPKKPEEILEALKDSDFLATNIKRYIKCLQAIRVEQLDRIGIEQRLGDANISQAEKYAELLQDINSAYVSELLHQGEIDFDDMIIRAFDTVSTGSFKPIWTDLLVDEFQDISAARMHLLEELIVKGPNPRLTVVGDDWQSIYRFSGGKLELITQFEKFVGKHSLTTLQKTFRYNNSIAKTAGQFVMQNPEQYTKHIETHHHVEKSQVYLLDSDKNNIDKRIKQIVQTITTNDPDGTIAVLARYRYLLSNAKDELSSLPKYTNIKYWTFHGSKGLEADYCIIVGLSRGKLGFPNENKEEAVVEALLPLVDGFKHSEERRLLYVAITRAKQKSYLIADPMAPSEFIEELLSPSYDLHIASKKFEAYYRKIFKCPSCTAGYFRLNSGKFGDFYQCTSGTACNKKPRICVKCSSPSTDKEKKSICQNPHCQETLKICFKCGRPMKLRKGRYGDFWGCSGYGIKSDQCNHTEKH
ncbi:UvrD-helicase domain-containing protein [Colwellia sp. BRX8-9]|uniref:UvrD-helicase domain-containing protein n=1 Tax=Colwellia sp. BRX8-9 TaxID=2759831 RepID=UPI0015F65AA0|nr:UvrD-helicase domain-containing protein [Colwellia sp. BRX8-9]MBA6348337.1 UvrD-helicase domain-containing protein [Colwellia sp. BRX8-9]